MGYAVLKAVHLLCVVVWVGGMFFTLACLRPALATLDGPSRVRLMRAALGRFLGVVVVAASLALLSGIAMIGIAASAPARAGIPFNMPLDWYVMTVLGLVMVGFFLHIRHVLYARLGRAVDAEDWSAGAAALAGIRIEVLVNLAIGVIVIVVTRLGSTF